MVGELGTLRSCRFAHVNIDRYLEASLHDPRIFASNDAHGVNLLLGRTSTIGDLIKCNILSIAPYSRSFNFTFTLGFGSFLEGICVSAPPVPLTVETLNTAHSFGSVDGRPLSPSLIIEFHDDPEYHVIMLLHQQLVTYARLFVQIMGFLSLSLFVMRSSDDYLMRSQYSLTSQNIICIISARHI